MDLSQALGHIRHGDTIGIGGMTLYRKPMAFVRGLVRRELRNLTVLGMCSGFEAELLAAAGSLGTLRTCYFGLEFLGLAPLLRKAVEQGRVKVVEETEYTIAVGLQAALMRVPYLPSRDCEVGTDFFRIRPDLRRAPCPVTGEELTWFPALAPRVAIIHAPMADEQGHTWLGGQHCVDAQLAMAADYTIVTVEKIVSTAEIKAAQGGAGLISFMVDAVVEAPGGAHPTSCYPDYPLDVVHLTNYLRQARGGGAAAYLAQYVHGPTGLPEYLKSIVEANRDPA
jgi:glutaconate CoA-transferase subunit A